MAKNEIQTASVLAFERKLDPSDALFYAGRWEQRADSAGWKAVEVREKSVRGTKSSRPATKGKEANPAKLGMDLESPNLQRVDVATLPPDADTLKARFTLRILGGAGVPSACNNSAYQQKLLTLVDGYARTAGFGELARRYASNIANARFLWRNRVGAEAVEVHVRHLVDGQAVNSWRFDALALSLREFASNEALDSLAKVIEASLSGGGYALLDINAFARMGDGQEVFPSQELILDKGTDRGGQKSKTLYTVGGIAGMHSQKLGNALRTIDTWYPDEDGIGPIAVEPYGSVTSRGKAYRQPRARNDFYSLLDGWMLKDQVPAVEQQHFVMATLIRGGVFGESGKD